MPDAHDPAVLVRHAVQAGDWQLVALLTRMLTDPSTVPATAARRAYTTLVSRLGLIDAGNHRR